MSTGEGMLEAVGVRKSYRLGKVRVPVLHGVDLRVDRGEFLAILGASGSGKSTLLHLLGGLDRPDEGEVRYGGHRVGGLGTAGLDRYRNRTVGFVFQFYHLLPELSVVQNVSIPALVDGASWAHTGRKGIEHRASELLDRFGLGHRLRHRPAELSGGERQRAAIARALINRPALLLADEPTGNLDRETGRQILDAIASLREDESNEDATLTMVVVTHDQATAERADRVVRLVDGVLDVEGRGVAGDIGRRDSRQH
ncbi:MAG: ABC transporter ATP-binding protein [Planctomycetota bacterium]